MASNFFGTIFRIVTWGESHGKAVGVVIDGCPAGVEIGEEEISTYLRARAPGKTPWTSPRDEKDQAEVLSGVFEGKTTGAPISILVWNRDVDSRPYEELKDILRPGHATFTYLQKYGIFDHRGGGRASARETVGRVAAGAVAQKFLRNRGVQVLAYLKQVGNLEACVEGREVEELRSLANKSPLFCPDEKISAEMMAQISQAKEEGNSLGGVVEFVAMGVPAGLGDPIYLKLEASLAQAMLTLPASKGFEIGAGFQAAKMSGASHNDGFRKRGDKIEMQTNHAGGTLAGISSGMPVIGRVAFKPTSSIRQPQETVNLAGDPVSLQFPEGSRHDPCVAIRAVRVVEAMLALVLADAFLLDRCARQ